MFPLTSVSPEASLVMEISQPLGIFGREPIDPFDTLRSKATTRSPPVFSADTYIHSALARGCARAVWFARSKPAIIGRKANSFTPTILFVVGNGDYT
jgi:hypothetical protein